MNRNEIIEWGARRLFNLENESLWSRADELVKQKYIMEATVCMSHPDLYLKVDTLLMEDDLPKNPYRDVSFQEAVAFDRGKFEMLGWIDESFIPMKED